MYTARKARTVGARRATSTRGRAFVAATGGALFGKAHALSEEVHMAMVSRGYTRRRCGTRPTRPGPRGRRRVRMPLRVGAVVLAIGVDRVAR